ncbi:hypothetical protein GHT06_009720 [Daphnia sinensis]|uniref:Protein kinase domain-containing protein n=1 Tax=Daphnia sinensis TaxID=1820382 RepID=A0AAD5Q075_9CRUS|nr:hypothetical protein GHT06_009720 [Daphnia sinensis]
MSNIIQTTLSFPALACGNEANINLQQMSIAYSIPEHVNLAIGDVKGSFLSDEEKQRRIAEKLLNETNCHGYFFDYFPNMNFKHLYLETCNETLDTYILKYATEIGFQWMILPEICCQLVDSVAWLHQRKLYYNGQLHPRNIFIKTSDTPSKVKLQVSEKPNPFHNLDTEYVNLWSGIKQSDLNKSMDEKAIQRDLASVAMVMFFIQSAGFHPFQKNSPLQPAEPGKYQGVQKQIERRTFNLVALDRKCFCMDKSANCEKTQCKYRLWINMLAKNRMHIMLTELFQETKLYTKESSGKIMEHPFFWKTSGVLRFIEKSSNYLKEAGDVKKKNLFCSSSQGQSNTSGRARIIQKKPLAANQRSQIHQPWILDQALLSKLENNHKDIFNYLHEVPARNDKNTGSTVPKPLFEKKNTITNFFGLLTQIRNKSAHWNEATSVWGKKAKEDLENMSFVADDEMDALHKFCLFWNIHFPELILYTWKHLKDVLL